MAARYNPYPSDYWLMYDPNPFGSCNVSYIPSHSLVPYSSPPRIIALLSYTNAFALCLGTISVFCSGKTDCYAKSNFIALMTTPALVLPPRINTELELMLMIIGASTAYKRRTF